MFEFAWLLLAFPALGVLITLLAGRQLGNRTVGMVASGVVVAAFAVALGLLTSLLALPAEERVITLPLWHWLTIGTLDVAAALLIDPLSVTMSLIVTGVGALIHIYSMSYMEHDERFQRFFLFLNFFIFAMLLLVLSDSFLGMFVGWEGVGLASYLLIGFWFDQRDDSYGYYADAGKKAFLVNRIGDFGMIVAMLAIWSSVGSLTFLEVFDAAHHGALAVGAANLICLMLLLAQHTAAVAAAAIAAAAVGVAAAAVGGTRAVQVNQYPAHSWNEEMRGRGRSVCVSKKVSSMFFFSVWQQILKSGGTHTHLHMPKTYLHQHHHHLQQQKTDRKCHRPLRSVKTQQSWSRLRKWPGLQPCKHH